MKLSLVTLGKLWWTRRTCLGRWRLGRLCCVAEFWTTFLFKLIISLAIYKKKGNGGCYLAFVSNTYNYSSSSNLLLFMSTLFIGAFKLHISRHRTVSAVRTLVFCNWKKCVVVNFVFTIVWYVQLVYSLTQNSPITTTTAACWTSNASLRFCRLLGLLVKGDSWAAALLNARETKDWSTPRTSANCSWDPVQPGGRLFCSLRRQN